MRRLRPVRGDLPRQRAQARPEALLDRGPDAKAGLRQALRDPASEAQLGPELPRGPRGCRAHRHRPVQDRLPRAHPRAGLPEARRAGPLHGRARAHQKRKPVPGRLRPHLQQALRGRVHPRRRGRGRRHRRGQALHRRPRPARGHALRAEAAQPDRPPVHGEDRRHRRRPRGHELCLLPRQQGLPRDRVRPQPGARRHAHARHPELPPRKRRAQRRDRHPARDGRRIPVRRRSRQRRHHRAAARAGLQGLLCRHRRAEVGQAPHPGRGARGCLRRRGLPARREPRPGDESRQALRRPRRRQRGHGRLPQRGAPRRGRDVRALPPQ